MANISSLATEYLRYQITAIVSGASYNPTADTAQFAFVTSGNPVTWYAGSWETIGSLYFARVLVGPGVGGVVTLAAGSWNVWCKITDNPEIPVRLVGTLVVA